MFPARTRSWTLRTRSQWLQSRCSNPNNAILTKSQLAVQAKDKFLDAQNAANAYNQQQMMYPAPTDPFRRMHTTDPSSVPRAQMHASMGPTWVRARPHVTLCNVTLCESHVASRSHVWHDQFGTDLAVLPFRCAVVYVDCRPGLKVRYSVLSADVVSAVAPAHITAMLWLLVDCLLGKHGTRIGLYGM